MLTTHFKNNNAQNLKFLFYDLKTAPEFFNLVIRLVWPLLSADTRKALKIHGTDRRTWRKILSNEINENQLLQNFGGAMSSNNV